MNHQAEQVRDGLPVAATAAGRCRRAVLPVALLAAAMVGVVLAPGAQAAGNAAGAARAAPAAKAGAPCKGRACRVVEKKHVVPGASRLGPARKAQGHISPGADRVAVAKPAPPPDVSTTTLTVPPAAPVTPTPPAPTPGLTVAAPAIESPSPIGTSPARPWKGDQGLGRRSKGHRPPGASAEMRHGASAGLEGPLSKGLSPSTEAARTSLSTDDGRLCDLLHGQCARELRLAPTCVRGVCTPGGTAGATGPTALARTRSLRVTGASLEGDAAAAGAMALQEVLPTAAEWRDAERQPPEARRQPLAMTQQLGDGRRVARTADCIAVGLQPSAGAQALRLSFDDGGRVHAAVAHDEVQRALHRTRFAGLDLSQPQRLCAPPDLARQLLNLDAGAPPQAATQLVRTARGWALATPPANDAATVRAAR